MSSRLCHVWTPLADQGLFWRCTGAVPRIGAVLVPINYRVESADFVYIAIILARACFASTKATSAFEAMRKQLPNVERFVALEGACEG
jgi:fatty-acyl-CoA synthase